MSKEQEAQREIRANWILTEGRKRMAIAQQNSFIDVATAQFLEQYRQYAEACAGSCLAQKGDAIDA